MANTIITKNSITASAVPTSGDLVQGELAVNVTDKRLFTENNGGVVVEVGTNPSSITTGNLTASGIVTIPDNAISGDKVEGGTINAVTINTLTSGTVDINGGAVDGTTVGATTPSTGAFTTLSASGTSTLAAVNSGALAVTGAISATTTINGALNGTLGATTPAAVNATTVTASGDIKTYSGSGSPFPGLTSRGIAIDASDSLQAIRISQTPTRGLYAYWAYNATPANAIAYLETHASANPIHINTASVFSSTGLAVTGAISATEIISANKGITFPATQVASADANTLDDYEEGTWTPNLYNNGSSSTWSIKVGRYIKVGNQVTCWANFDGGGSGSSTGALILTGLPFSQEASGGTWQCDGVFQASSSPNQGSVTMQNSGGASAQLWVGGSQKLETVTFASVMFTYRVA